MGSEVHLGQLFNGAPIYLPCTCKLLRQRTGRVVELCQEWLFGTFVAFRAVLCGRVNLETDLRQGFCYGRLRYEHVDGADLVTQGQAQFVFLQELFPKCIHTLLEEHQALSRLAREHLILL